MVKTASNIAIISKDLTDRLCFAAIFESQHHTVSHARSIEHAIVMLKNDVFDLVLVEEDLFLSFNNELLPQLKTIGAEGLANIPVVIFGRDQAVDIADYDHIKYLRSPYRMNDLLRLVS